MAEERLQKILARAGVSSRRAAEHLITNGQVSVNGQVVSELGTRADAERDRIEVDGRAIGREEHVYFVVHKPRGMVTTLSDPEDRPSLSELLTEITQRVYPIGRLDFHTSGALLLTNDGDLAQALLHPSREVPKTYVAKISHKLDDKGIYMLRSGVTLDDGYHTRPASVIELRVEEGKSWLELTITEGKNRQIHRMIEAIGARVMRLSRISFAGISSEGLRPGQIRELDPAEVAALRRSYLGIKARVEARGSEREQNVAVRGSGRAQNEGARESAERKLTSAQRPTRNTAPEHRKSVGARAAQVLQTAARKKPDTFDRTRGARHKKGPT
jgi:23S rRNA pseudouridine2605 synthase